MHLRPNPGDKRISVVPIEPRERVCIVAAKMSSLLAGGARANIAPPNPLAGFCGANIRDKKIKEGRGRERKVMNGRKKRITFLVRAQAFAFGMQQQQHWPASKISLDPSPRLYRGHRDVARARVATIRTVHSTAVVSWAAGPSQPGPSRPTWTYRTVAGKSTSKWSSSVARSCCCCCCCDCCCWWRDVSQSRKWAMSCDQSPSGSQIHWFITQYAVSPIPQAACAQSPRTGCPNYPLPSQQSMPRPVYVDIWNSIYSVSQKVTP